MSSSLAMQQIYNYRIMVILISTIAILHMTKIPLVDILEKDYCILHQAVWKNQYIPISKDIFHFVYIWQLLT